MSVADRDPDLGFLRLAFEQAQKSYREGGLPIGAVMVEDGQVLAAGHNRRVQDGDPTAHGEMDCLRRAGRRARYDGVCLYTTLSPCMMCAGTILQFGVRQPGGNGDSGAHLAVHLHRDNHFVRFGDVRIECGPAGGTETLCVAEPLPELLGGMRRERREHHNQGIDGLAEHREGVRGFDDPRGRLVT